ncbi:MAG: AAA family ATPase [Armatimonadetes bacterium]|nr:AAA family ATPase [Armatimonadota bacterium]
MRLKQLELFGFKTFADSTTLVFDEGITAVIGPNGSGKSNTADALLWVLATATTGSSPAPPSAGRSATPR